MNEIDVPAWFGFHWAQPAEMRRVGRLGLMLNLYRVRYVPYRNTYLHLGPLLDDINVHMGVQEWKVLHGENSTFIRPGFRMQAIKMYCKLWVDY